MFEILIADDSETFRYTLSSDLKERGYTVHQASDGIEALKLLRQTERIDLIILDVNMPGADGLEVLEVCQKENLLKDKIVFMLTANSSNDLKERGKMLGVKAWITKPYKKETLMMAIEKVLGK